MSFSTWKLPPVEFHQNQNVIFNPKTAFNEISWKPKCLFSQKTLNRTIPGVTSSFCFWGFLKARIKLMFLKDTVDTVWFWPHFYQKKLEKVCKNFEKWYKGDFLEWQDPWRKFLIWRDIGKTVEVWETEIALGTFGTKAYHPKSTQYHPWSTHK